MNGDNGLGSNAILQYHFYKQHQQHNFTISPIRTVQSQNFSTDRPIRRSLRRPTSWSVQIDRNYLSISWI